MGPQRGSGAEPLVRGGHGAKPEAEDYFASGDSIDLYSFSVFHSVQCGSVSESCEICHLS